MVTKEFGRKTSASRSEFKAETGISYNLSHAALFYSG